MEHYVIKMPDIGEGIAEVEIVEWHVAPGDMVAEDQVLADVMTDKASVEIPSPIAGTVESLGGEVGDVLAVGANLIVLNPASTAGQAGSTAGPAEAPGDSTQSAGDPAMQGTQPGSGIPDTAATPGRPDAAPASEPGSEPDPAAPSAAAVSAPAAKTSAPVDTGARANKVLASPSVRWRARQLDIDLSSLPGAGDGPIGHRDLDAYLLSNRAAAAAPHAGPLQTDRPDTRADEPVKVVGLRRQIAQKMQEAKRQIPHFSYVEEIDVTELERLRKTLNAEQSEGETRLTLLPFLIRAMVLAVRRYPEINARYDDHEGVVTRYGAVHMGVATQTPKGLMVPVLREADRMSLRECAMRIGQLAADARQGRAQLDQLSGSTITLTSLGALGGIVSTPIINYPEVAIVGVNRIVERLVLQDGVAVPRKTMNLSSSFDHRVVDGMQAAQFIQEMRRLLECPALLFMEGQP